MVYNLLIDGVYWGYNPLTNHLLTSWDIQVGFDMPWDEMDGDFSWVDIFLLGRFLHKKGSVGI